MQCEFTYCIYNKNALCILGDIQIDPLGMCDACEIAAIPEKLLTEHKEKRLKAIDEAAAQWGGKTGKTSP